MSKNKAKKIIVIIATIFIAIIILFFVNRKVAAVSMSPERRLEYNEINQTISELDLQRLEAERIIIETQAELEQINALKTQAETRKKNIENEFLSFIPKAHASQSFLQKIINVITGTAETTISASVFVPSEPETQEEDKLDPELLQLMIAIANHEGWENPANLVRRYNNPGAMKAVDWCEYSLLGYRNFMIFEKEDDGWQCLATALERYRDKGATIRSLIARWAPSSDGNNPTSYAYTVASKLGVPVDTKLSDLF